MKRLVAVGVVFLLCMRLFATEPVDPAVQHIMALWAVAAMIMVRLVHICEAVCADENISPTLRAEMLQTIDECINILEQLGISVRRPSVGLHG